MGHLKSTGTSGFGGYPPGHMLSKDGHLLASNCPDPEPCYVLVTISGTLAAGCPYVAAAPPPPFPWSASWDPVSVSFDVTTCMGPLVCCGWTAQVSISPDPLHPDPGTVPAYLDLFYFVDDCTGPATFVVGTWLFTLTRTVGGWSFTIGDVSSVGDIFSGNVAAANCASPFVITDALGTFFSAATASFTPGGCP